MRRYLPALLPLALVISQEAAACASCGCSLSSDWTTQGVTTREGLSADLRYDFVDQQQLRLGRRTASASDVAQAQADGREVERRTTNRYETLGLNYNPSRVWGFTVQLPWVVRTHSTTDNTVPATPEDLTSRSNSLGDIRLLTRYQGFDGLPNVGVIAGLKLPTGRFHERFNETGDPLDRSLQPGTGTTDAIVGAYAMGAVNRHLDWFGQAVAQLPLAEREGYRPGSSVSVNLGLRYMSAGALVPELQLNAINRDRDRQDGAGVEGTGGSLVYITPGASLVVGKRLSLFTHVQLPVYQGVNELQLAPRANYAAGLHYRFD